MSPENLEPRFWALQLLCAPRDCKAGWPPQLMLATSADAGFVWCYPGQFTVSQARDTQLEEALSQELRVLARVPAGKQGAGSEQTQWGLGTGSFSKACKGKGTRLTPYVQGGGAGHGQSPVATWGGYSTQFSSQPLAFMLL